MKQHFSYDGTWEGNERKTERGEWGIAWGAEAEERRKKVDPRKMRGEKGEMEEEGRRERHGEERK